MARKTVLFVLGSAFSGSSLLNKCLDTQPMIRGLGEACHLVLSKTDAFCSNCQAPVFKCPTRSMITGKVDRLYEILFDYYGCDVLVNASKHPRLCFRKGCFPSPEHDVKFLVIAKMPHAFIWSWMKHNKRNSVMDGFGEWANLYAHIAMVLDGAIAGEPGLIPRQILPDDIRFVSYERLARNHRLETNRICQWLGTRYVNSHAIDPWGFPTDTHTIGGNNAIYAQTTRNEVFFSEAKKDYLDGKYVGKYHQVFEDRQWYDQTWFRLKMLQVYKQHMVRFATVPLLQRLGMWKGHICQLIADLDLPEAEEDEDSLSFMGRVFKERRELQDNAEAS